MRFFCIDDAVPEQTVRLLRIACELREIPFVHIRAGIFEYDATQRPRAGDLMYRPAVSATAQRVEQWLAGPGVATFHTDPEGVHFPATNPGLIFEAHGLPVPRTFYCQTADRQLLLARAQACGGFPVVLKVPGHSRGIGVMRADSPEALVSLVDFALSAGRTPMLMPYVEAEHWRVVVVGDRAVAAYRNPRDVHDFRSYGSTNPVDFTCDVPGPLANLALRAVHAQRLELGGVDILEHSSGRLYLLEANFPLYHAHAEEVADIDVSGSMVEHLAAKAGKPARRGPGRTFTRLASTPLLRQIDDFATPEETARVVSMADDPAWLADHGVETKRDLTGTSCEMPVVADPLLASLAKRMRAAVGLDNHFGATLRFRRYEVGEAHPPHCDHYEIGGMRLVATALLYLSDAEGGATVFPQSLPGPVEIPPVRGRLAWWHNHAPDGSPEPASLHEALPVTAGIKAVLGQFFYLPPSALSSSAEGVAAPPA